MARDVDPAALACARLILRHNRDEGASVALSDALGGVSETAFDKILCNPPYHTDFSVPKRLIEKAFNRRAAGGGLRMVTKRELWRRNKLRSVFGGVRCEVYGGYFVFEATRRSFRYANSALRPARASPRATSNGR